MSNNFAEYINRVGTDSAKWDGFEELYPGLNSKDSIPMWVADTDFKAPQEVIDAIVEKANSEFMATQRQRVTPLTRL